MNNKNRSDNRPTVGQELTARLGRFVDKIEKTQSVTELPKIVTVRRVKLDLRPRPFSAEELRSIRLRIGVSQAVLAEYLGVSLSTIRDWEQGRHEISGPVCRLLAEIAQDLDGWARKLQQLTTVDQASG